MCSPTLAITAVGTVFSAYNQMQQANAQAEAMAVQAENQKRIADYNAQVQENAAIVSDRNAELADNRAVDAVRRGANEAAEIRERVQRMNATGRAMQGSSGLLVDEGNFADILDQNLVFGEVDALQTVNNAEREAYGFRMDAHNFSVQGTDLRNQAGITRAGGQAAFDAGMSSAANTKRAGLLNATDTLVSGAVDFGKMGGFNSNNYKSKTRLKSGEVIYWNSRR